MLQDRSSQQSRTAVVIVTGYAAAGKTHVVNALISELQGQPVGVIAHRQAEEFHIVTNAVTPHAAFIGEVYDFGSGCICCSPTGDLTRLLLELAHRRELRLSLLLIRTGPLAAPLTCGT